MELKGPPLGDTRCNSDYFVKWGWYVSIEMIANNDILKIDKVLATKVHEFHTFLAHKLDRQKMEAQLRKPNVRQL